MNHDTLLFELNALDDETPLPEPATHPDIGRPLTPLECEHFLAMLEHCLDTKEVLRMDSDLLKALQAMRFQGEPCLQDVVQQVGPMIQKGYKPPRRFGAIRKTGQERAEAEQVGRALSNLSSHIALRDKLFLDGAPWYDWVAWEACYKQCSNASSDSDREWRRGLERMRNRGPFARFGRIPSVQSVLDLQARHPNFAEPIDFIAQQVALCRRRGDDHLHLPPMLLNGPAGVGKTHFAQSLAKTLSSACQLVDCATQSAGFSLGGLDRRWSSGGVGQVASAFLMSDTIAPLFFLDELDKVNIEAKSSPVGPLYTLLERESARTFRDEYLELPIDASHIHWLAASNALEPIALPLQSRFKCFEIPTPDPQQMRGIVQGLFDDMVRGLALQDRTMPQAWLQRIEGQSVRLAQRALAQALGRSALRAERQQSKTLELLADDMALPERTGPMRPGFY